MPTKGRSTFMEVDPALARISREIDREEAPKKPKTDRPKKDWPHADRVLIGAARDELIVGLYFSLDSMIHQEVDLYCKVKVVDTYFLQICDADGELFWIQKHLLAGFQISPESDFTKSED